MKPCRNLTQGINRRHSAGATCGSNQGAPCFRSHRVASPWRAGAEQVSEVRADAPGPIHTHAAIAFKIATVHNNTNTENWDLLVYKPQRTLLNRARASGALNPRNRPVVLLQTNKRGRAPSQGDSTLAPWFHLASAILEVFVHNERPSRLIRPWSEARFALPTRAFDSHYYHGGT